MSLTASLWTSVSGLITHGEKMNVVGNNIANVNTVGFKQQRMDFQDFVYQYIGTAGGIGQVGRGVGVGLIFNDFSQGATETTTGATDIVINGNGFFSVKPLNNNVNYYTRAGNFTFNKDGYLVDPHGYVLQGWKISTEAQLASSDPVSTGSGIISNDGDPRRVRLENFTCPPRHTQNITLPVNLRNSKTASEDDKCMVPEAPMFALLRTWNADQNPPLGQDMYAYQSTMEVYDEAGRLHKLTIYFDRISNVDKDDPTQQHIGDGTPGESYWEYIITMDPTEDMRDFTSDWDPTGNAATNPNVPDSLKGLLGAGTITFNSSGEMKDMTCFVPQAQPTSVDTNGGKWWSSTTVNTVYRGPGTQITPPLPSGVTEYFNNTGTPMYFNPADPSQTNGSDPGGWTEVPDGEYYYYQTAQKFENDLSKWVPAPFSSDGFPMIAPNFSGTAGQQMAYYDGKNDVLPSQSYDYANPNKFASGRMIAVDFGLKNKDRSWHFPRAGTDVFPDGTNISYSTAFGGHIPANTLPLASDLYTDAVNRWQKAGTDPTTGVDYPGPSKLLWNGLDGFGTVQATRTTNLGDNFYEQPGKKQDGYTYGDLRYVNVSTDGVLSAAYSNGVTLQLYQITLYDFPSKQNLRREGGNLFTETRESGLASSGAAGTGTFGTTQGYSLEQSNVDLSREFVNMITTQRGFQANSKSITTVDTMLETVISMKR
ncbi:MAG: flagellar hook-basal body complex protein [Desulfovibrio sp.]|jgi:flagellar hook protein FlgE|nr:flagellar hook-basal body complex protein [Desulfovibrio sp.]